MYPTGDAKQHGSMRVDHRDKVCKIQFDLRELALAPLQRERFVFLMGPRYREGHRQRLVARKALTYLENYDLVFDQLRELYWEALRAPTTMSTFIRNPYRREKFIKKTFGKTAEERKMNY